MNDAELLRQFEELTLPFAEWTHRAHVRVAYCYLEKHSFEEALPIVRTRIQKYNAANKVPEGPLSGYNETTTHAMLHLIAATRAAYAKTHPVTDSNSFCDMHPQLLNKHTLRLFYSPQRRIDPRAKSQFVEPDLSPLPKIIRTEE